MATPKKTCICDLAINVDSYTQLIIWQHPQEEKHPKGTAQLLHMCMRNSIIHRGEKLSSVDLGIDKGNCSLLYPIDDNTPALTEEIFAPKQLLIIDGTWRKSRRIIHENPWLLALPRITLPEKTRNYRIRKSESVHQLSTFEAGVLAIDLVEKTNHFENALASVFEKFVQHWEQFTPN